MHAERVVKQGYRPKVDTTWPSTWIDVMKECWQRDLRLRPDFYQIASILEDQVILWENEEGVIPTRGSEIRAKKRKKNVVSERLDMDTRIASDEDTTARRHDADIV